MDWKLVSATGHRLVSRPYTLRQIYLGKLIHNTSKGSFLKMFSKQTASFECNFRSMLHDFHSTNSWDKNDGGLDTFKENTELLYANINQLTINE